MRILILEDEAKMARLISRALSRREWPLIAFGVSLAIFTASYDAAKAADSELVVGSDLRVAPSALSDRRHPPSFASRLEVPGVESVAPVAFKLENSVLYAPFNQDVKDLAAIDPESFERVAALWDSLFVDRSVAEAGLIAIGGLAGGVLVGVGMAYLLVHVLRPLFILDATLTLPAATIATLAGVAMVAALASALSAAAMLRRLRPTELLREA